MFEFLKVVSPGCGASWQDAGRPGWKRFGVPPGGWMDGVAAREANRLAGNPENAVVMELALQGAEFEVLRSGWLALAGADMGWTPGTARRVEKGERLRFKSHRHGVYAYLAAPGGWETPAYLGSASVFAAGGLGKALAAGDIVGCLQNPGHEAWAGVATRYWEAPVHPAAIEVQVGRGLQWAAFAPEALAAFFGTAWSVSARSNRTGVRLDGPALETPEATMLSEPVPPGSVQVTGGGQPVVTMCDGPTVGGYPKIAWLDEEACRRVAQVPPGGTIRWKVEG